MGRANRRHWTETHPDRELWSPGRLAQARTQTEEEYEALYGRSREPLAEEKLRSVFWTSPELLRRLASGTLNAEERIEFLYDLDADFLEEAGPEELVRDSAFRKFFDDQWNDLPVPIRAKIASVYTEMQGFMAEGLLVFARTHRAAGVYDDPARDQAPSSLLGAAIWSGAIDGGDIAEVVDRDLVLSEILPQLEYIRRIDARSGPNAFLQKVWRELWQSSGSPANLDIESDLRRIDDLLARADSGTRDRYFAEDEEARRCRVYRRLFHHIGGERNLGDMFRESVQQGLLGSAAMHGRQRALAKEIEEIGLLHEDSDEIFEETMTYLMKKDPRRLEFLRPLFEGKEHLLDEVEEELNRSSLYQPYQLASTIQRAIWKGCEHDNFSEDFHKTVLDQLR